MSLSVEEQVKRIQNSSLNNPEQQEDECLAQNTITDKIKAIRWAMQYRDFNETTIEFVDSVETYLETYGRISPKQHDAINNIIRNNGIEV